MLTSFEMKSFSGYFRSAAGQTETFVICEFAKSVLIVKNGSY